MGTWSLGIGLQRLLERTLCVVSHRFEPLRVVVVVGFGLLAIDVGIAQAQVDLGTELVGPATVGDGLIRHEAGAYDGYNLLNPSGSKTTYLVDMSGHIVHSWETDFSPASLAYLLPSGHLLRTAQEPNPLWGPGPAAGGRVQEFDWDGELVWDFRFLDDKTLPHHDFASLPNGNVLLIVKERKSAEQCIAAGAVPGTTEGLELQIDGLVEIKPTGKTTGEVVWSWHLWDHLVQDYDANQANFGNVADHPELVDFNFDRGKVMSSEQNRESTQRRRPDWTHANGVAYNEELDQIVLSIHEFSEVWIIDHSTTTEQAAGHSGGRSDKGGDLLYRWGNPLVYRAGTKEDQTLFAQHDAHWIAEGLPGEGHLMVFNNGSNRPGGNHSTVDELELPLNADGTYALLEGGTYGPKQAVWSYSAPNPSDFYSHFISGAARLPNGNTMICSGASGILFEVTADKQVVWNYMNPDHRGNAGDGRRRNSGGPNGRSLFRVYRYGLDYPGLAGKVLTPGTTLIELANQTASDAESPAP